MIGFFVLVRDAILSALLGWIGVAYEPAPSNPLENRGGCAAAGQGESATTLSCPNRVKTFSALTCGQ